MSASVSTVSRCTKLHVDWFKCLNNIPAGFECVLDRNQKAVPYSEPSQLQITEDGKVQWDSGSVRRESRDVPAGARRCVYKQ